ncbi:MAG: DUF6519 domain-containing protein [Micromonosporaceae bacterium]
MSRAISRESFSELNNYLGVYLQQGRAILDADWNENQDIAVSFLQRLGREALGDGSPNRGFAIDPVFPPPPSLLLGQVDTTGLDLSQALGAIIGACLGDLVNLTMYLIFGPLLFFLDVPGALLEDFESLEGFALSSALGQIRIGKDQPYLGTSFLRLSGHPGPVQVTKTLPGVKDLSEFELATFRFRLNHLSPGTMKFFLEDDSGNRSVWLRGNPALAQDIWLAGFAAPLNISFRIVTERLAAAVAGQSYSAQLFTYAGTTPMQWTVSAGTLPGGLTLAPSGTDEESRRGTISGTPTTSGSSTFTVTVTDGGGHTTSKQFILEVRASGRVGLQIPTATEFLSLLGKSEAPTGTPADLTAIRSYGFELYQDAANPLIWDLDDLRLGSSALQDAAAKNNFIIRGSELAQLLNQVTLLSALMAGTNGTGSGTSSNPEQNLLDLLNTDLDLTEPSVESAGRMYVDGLPCLQVDDVLYSHQADPNDDPLTPPPGGNIRRDTVYLDVWTEPVTYIQDPAIRDVALGGPDTATRQAVRQRVRVAQGGKTPRGDGIGDGTLATEGSYTATANRLYLVEIDTAGSIGDQATFRWSDDNAATIQRVIEPIPPQSTKVVVEDAAAFHQGDQILIRKEFGEERHEVSSVFANEITLISPTGSQLEQYPAAARDPAFTTFSLADRPMVQRWNAYEVPILADPADATISAAIGLNDGVQVRFGGRGMLKGDYWTFTTRYLAGDEVSGIDPMTRIERLDFQRARGVTHHYATLAVITRDGDADEPDQIFQVEDRRGRVGNANTASGTLPDLTALTGTASAHLGALRLPPGAQDSKLLVFWSGDLFLQDPVPGGNATLTIRVSFYNDEMTDPVNNPDTGKIQDREAKVTLGRRPLNVDVPLQLLFSKSDTGFAFLPPRFAPTSLQVFAVLDKDGFTVQLTSMQLTAIELKKSF